MAVTINVDGANTYFAADSHRYWRVWGALQDEDKTALVATAKRVISRTIGVDVEAETVTDDSQDYYRPDYAVYEQALYCIPPHLIANGEFSAPHWIGMGEDGEPSTFPEEGSISPEAQRWLDVRSGPTISLARG